MSKPQYNLRSPAVKRILNEVRELQKDPSDEFVARPLEEDIFEWHFTIRGPPDTEYEGGLYHGRIILPPEYPMKPPSIILLTPNGRFEVGKKICLSITGYHPEFWQPAWGIRSVCTALQSFFPTPGGGAIGALDYTPDERRIYAKKSMNFICNSCKDDERMNPARLLAAIERKSPISETLADGLSINFAFAKPKQASDASASSSSTLVEPADSSSAAIDDVFSNASTEVLVSSSSASVNITSVSDVAINEPSKPSTPVAVQQVIPPAPAPPAPPATSHQIDFIIAAVVIVILGLIIRRFWPQIMLYL